MQSATPSGQKEPTTGFAPASAANQINTAKTGAFFSRATSATSTSARSRTPWSSFGGCRLSQEHTRVTLLFLKGSQGIRRELNPYLLVHSQACSNRYTTDTV